MKNIHILPIDKPSNLLLCVKDYIEHINTEAENSDKKGNFRLGFGIYANTEFYQHQNTYITSDEEIKEGDYIFYSINRVAGKVLELGRRTSNGENIPVVYCKETGSIDTKDCTKIILTTDQDLIKDGVQAIDNEFLEWFIKNPSCEKVDVTNVPDFIYETKHSCYKIIIPKEDIQQVGIDWSRFPKSTQEKVGYLEPKQETIEEAAKNYAIDNSLIGYELMPYKGFINGAKWQQERSYSEEEVFELLENLVETFNPPTDNLKKWFEQFKKK